jgi:hypothetical protein
MRSLSRYERNAPLRPKTPIAIVVAVSAGERLDDIAGEAILSAARMSHDDFQRDLRQLNGLLNQRAFMVMTYVATTDALASRLQAQ